MQQNACERNRVPAPRAQPQRVHSSLCLLTTAHKQTPMAGRQRGGESAHAVQYGENARVRQP